MEVFATEVSEAERVFVGFLRPLPRFIKERNVFRLDGDNDAGRLSDFVELTGKAIANVIGTVSAGVTKTQAPRHLWFRSFVNRFGNFIAINTG